MDDRKALILTLECAVEEIEMGMTLYNAVDDLFHAPGKGYPDGHFNEDRLDNLREIFLHVSDADNYRCKDAEAADLLHHELMRLIGGENVT